MNRNQRTPWLAAMIAASLCAIIGVVVITLAGAATLVQGDINKDGKVDVFDISILLSKWGTADATADINASGKVDVFDISILLSHWGATGATPSPTASTTPTATPVSAISSSNPCGVVATPPARYKHVIAMYMENHPYTSVVGNSAGVYQSQLAKLCGTSTNFSAVASPSKPNYIAATSGSTWGIADNNDPPSGTQTADNVFRQVRAAGGVAKSYQESMPGNCYLAVSSDALYKPKHNPEVYYIGGTDRTDCQKYNVPMGTTTSGAFISDLASDATLPTFSFITPNMCNDSHDCSVATGDAWVKKWMTLILDSPSYKSGNTAVLFMYDEANGSSAGTFPVNYPAPDILIAPSVTKGKVTGTRYDQYSVSRTISELLGLPLLQKATTATSFRGEFNL